MTPSLAVMVFIVRTHRRRINIQHRLVYQVLRRDRIVKVLRMWTHYE